MSLIYILLVFFLIMPKIGSFDIPVISLFICFSIVFVRNHLIGSRKIVSININKNHYIMIILMIFLFALTVVSFFVNHGGNVDLQFLAKPIRVVIIMFLLAYITSSERIEIKDAAFVLIIATTINSSVVISQYMFQVLFGISDFLLNPNFSESVITPYRKPGLMSGYPTAGIFSIFGVLSIIYVYMSKLISNKLFFLLFLINTVACFLTARTAVYMWIVFALPYLILTLFYFKKHKEIVLIFLIFSSFSSYIISSDNKVLDGTLDKMFANVNNYIETGSFNDYSTEDLLENHYEFPDDPYVFFFGNSTSPSESLVNSDVSIFRITWYSGFPSSLLYLIACLFMWITAIKGTLLKRDKLFINVFFIVFIISNAKGFYFFSRVLGDSSLLIWSALCSFIPKVNNNE